jgi:hypothetical protein
VIEGAVLADDDDDMLDRRRRIAVIAAALPGSRSGCNRCNAVDGHCTERHATEQLVFSHVLGSHYLSNRVCCYEMHRQRATGIAGASVDQPRL